MLKTWTFSISQNVLFVVFCDIHWRSFFCFFDTWSFTLCKNDLDPDDKSNSVSPSPMMNCCGLAPPLRRNNGNPRSIEIFFFDNDVLVLTRETWLRRVRSSLRANNGFLRSIIFLSLHTQRTLTFITSLPRAFWCPRWYFGRHPCNIAHLWSRFSCDTFFSWILLRSFCHCSGSVLRRSFQ